MTIQSCPYIAKPAIYITPHLVFHPPISHLAVGLIISNSDMFENFPAILVTRHEVNSYIKQPRETGAVATDRLCLFLKSKKSSYADPLLPWPLVAVDLEQ